MYNILLMPKMQFIPPSIKGHEILNQNFMSNTSFINGEMKSEHKQQFFNSTQQTGMFIIPATVIKIHQDGKTEEVDARYRHLCETKSWQSSGRSRDRWVLAKPGRSCPGKLTIK